MLVYWVIILKKYFKLIVFVILLLFCYIAYLETLKNVPLLNIESSTTISTIMSDFSFQLYPPDKIIIPRVDYYVMLPNGTQIYFGARNPLQFKLRISPEVKLYIPKELEVFKVEVFNDENHALELASKLGYLTDTIPYDSETGTYVVHNSTHCFEYSKGHFRLWRIDRSEFAGNFPSDNILVEKAKDFFYKKGLLVTENYQTTVGVFKTVDEKTCLKYVSFKMKINDLVIEGLSLNAIFNSEGEIVEAEGFIASKIEVLKAYPTKTSEEIISELRDKIASGAPRWDWKIDTIAFTEMNITDIKLKYYYTIEGYIVPVCEIKGYSSLDIDGINYMKRENTAILIAVKRI